MNPVVQAGVKSAGCENGTSQRPLSSDRLRGQSMVLAEMAGAERFSPDSASGAVAPVVFIACGRIQSALTGSFRKTRPFGSAGGSAPARMFT